MNIVQQAFYADPGVFTDLTDRQRAEVLELGLGPVDLCRLAQSIVVGPGDPFGAGLSDQAARARNLRPASAILRRAVELGGPVTLGQDRPADQRVVGTCRHFAVLATAFLRAGRVPARARCGFAAYFEHGKKVDHWITELWSEEDGRWIRVDAEHLDLATPGDARTDDLRPGEFLDAGEAWRFVRSGGDDPDTFGVFGTSNWGSGEIRGNAMRDLASLAAKVEMLPWDEWGPMTDSYAGRTGDDFDALIDELAASTIGTDMREMQRIYERLAVPASMIR